MKLIFSALFSLFLLQLQAQTPNATTIQFGLDKSTLTPTSKEQLKNFVKESQVIHHAAIELHGHCDSSGSSAYNDLLSIRRVKVVRQFLLSEGIADSVIVVQKGHGEKTPLNDNATKEERSLNRRVAIVASSNGNSSGSPLTINQLLKDTTIKAGAKIVLKNINFIGGRHYFIAESRTPLEELLSAMKSHPKLVIRIEGHICCGTSAELDGMDIDTGIQDLSVARAKAVQDYLINNGIEANRISYTGFGHSRPLYPYPEKSPEEELANRRVEIVITAL